MASTHPGIRSNRCAMAELVLGPILRHVGERDATVWVEADEACEVEVLGHTEPTFCVDGHHYALVCIDGARAGLAIRVRGQPGRRAPVAGGGLRVSRQPDPHPRSRAGAARLVRLLPRRAADGAAVRLHEGRARRRRRGRRAPRLRARADPRPRRPVAGPAADARRPDLRRRGIARDPRVHPLAPRRLRASGRGGARLRGVHAPVSRVVERAVRPVAVLDRPHRDGDRRSRHQRRLEHLPLLEGGDGPPRPGGTGGWRRAS